VSGICAIIRFSSEEVKKKELEKMLGVMQNRGSDAEGIWIEGSVGFGHKMLWTTSESLHEKQPLVGQDEKLVLTADARIDNREELIKKLEISKDNYKVLTDAELILLSYQKWGEDCPRYLMGDFSFLIWDKYKKKLFGARDHIGIKPFYYFHNDNFFVVSSEAMSFFHLVEFKRIPNIESMKFFLATHTIAHHETFYKTLYRLEPGHTIEIVNRQINIKRYWFPEKIRLNKNITFEEASMQFRELLTEAVKARLRSHKSIGFELSGGLDSSSILSIATKVLKCYLPKVFSMRYRNMQCDESMYIDAVEEDLKISTININAADLDYQNKYSISAFYHIYPYWPGNALFLNNLFEFEKAKSEHVRVVLTGQGGDHIVGGNLYRFADLFRQVKLLTLWKELRLYSSSVKIFKRYVLPQFLNERTKKILRTLLHRDTLFYEQKHYKSLRQTECLTATEEYRYDSLAHKEDLSMIIGALNATWIDNNPYQLAGRYNIEFRHPFFDIRLVEFTLSLPSEYKLKNGVDKQVLRSAMQGILVDVVRNRNTKAEFSQVLLKQINSEDIARIEKNSILVDNGLMDKNELKDLIHSYKNNNLTKIMLLWKVILLETWYTEELEHIRE